MSKKEVSFLKEMDPEVLDQWFLWAKIRLDKPKKLANLPHLIKFHESLKRISKRQKIYFLFADLIKAKFLSNTLMYRGGSPNYTHFKISPGGEYILYNPKYHLWKNQTIDPNIINKYLSFKNNRYEQPNKTIELPEHYNLFALQLTSRKFGAYDLPLGKMEIEKDDPRYSPNGTFFGELGLKGIELTEHDVMPRDEWATRDAIRHAKETKTYTIFKAHPVASSPNTKTWDNFIKEGILNEYCIFVDGHECNVDYLIDHADLVYSSDSAVSFSAMLKGKPTATYYNTDMSEIIPTIKTSDELVDIKTIPEEDVKRFLSWYYHKLCFDIEQDDYEDKIERMVVRFKNGERTKELFA